MAATTTSTSAKELADGVKDKPVPMGRDLFWSIMKAAPTNVKVAVDTPNGNVAKYSTKSNMETADKIARSESEKMSLIVQTFQSGGKVKATIAE